MQRTFINFLFLLVFSFQSLAQIKTTDKNQMTDNRSVVAGEGRYAKLPLNFLYKKPTYYFEEKIIHSIPNNKIYVGDMDKDGIPEILCSNYSKGYIHCLKYANNQYETRVIDTLAQKVSKILMQDINNDQQQDIIAIVDKSIVGYIQNKDTRQWVSHLLVTSPATITSLVAEDINKDALPDFIYGVAPYSIHKAMSRKPLQYTMSLFDPKVHVFGEMCIRKNKDSAVELIIPDYKTATLLLVKLSKKGDIAKKLEIDNTFSGINSCAWVDFDHDGYDDILATSFKTGKTKLYSFVHEDYYACEEILKKGFEPTQIHLTDFDKNGKNEMVINNQADKPVIITSHGYHLYDVDKILVSAATVFSLCADLDNDQDTDILCSTKKGLFALYNRSDLEGSNLVTNDNTSTKSKNADCEISSIEYKEWNGIHWKSDTTYTDYMELMKTPSYYSWKDTYQNGKLVQRRTGEVIGGRFITESYHYDPNAPVIKMISKGSLSSDSTIYELRGNKVIKVRDYPKFFEPSTETFRYKKDSVWVHHNHRDDHSFVDEVIALDSIYLKDAYLHGITMLHTVDGNLKISPPDDYNTKYDYYYDECNNVKLIVEINKENGIVEKVRKFDIRY
ncbi:MAG: VCBS repeat-containing protein [Saprospiraceae bacterium]|nr:VCBS repeat-containing protein [Saprospiraceae bacterium]